MAATINILKVTGSMVVLLRGSSTPGKIIQRRNYFVENCSRKVTDTITKVTLIYSGELEDQGDGCTAKRVPGVRLDQHGTRKAQCVKPRSERNQEDSGKARGRFFVLHNYSRAAACLSVASFRRELDPVHIT
jgi:hypothetical protein